MKKLSINKFLLTILIFCIPLNFIIIDTIGNAYISTLLIFLESLLLIFIVRDKLINKPNVLIAILFFIAFFLSTILNILFDEGEMLKSQAVNGIIYLQNLLVFVISYYVLEKIYISYFFNIFLIAIVIASIRIGIEEPDKIFNFSTISGERIEALFIGGVNNYALLLAVAFIISFFTIKHKFFKLIVCLFWLVLIALTMSRGALLGAIITVFLVAFYDKDKKTLKSLIRFSLGLSLFAIIALIYFNKVDVIINQFNERFFGLFTGDTSIDKFSSGRGIIWNDIITKIHSSSFFEIIFGHGFGSIDFIVEGARYESSHNIFIDILYKNGLIALISYLVFIIILFLRFINYRNKEKLTIFGVFIFLHLELIVNPFAFAAQMGWIYSIFLVIFIKQNSYQIQKIVT